MRPEPDYPPAVELALDWVEEHRDELVAAEPVDGIAQVDNLNVPTCPSGSRASWSRSPSPPRPRPRAWTSGAVDCEAAPAEDPTNDVNGFLAGHPVLSELTA